LRDFIGRSLDGNKQPKWLKEEETTIVPIKKEKQQQQQGDEYERTGLDESSQENLSSVTNLSSGERDADIVRDHQTLGKVDLVFQNNHGKGGTLLSTILS